MGMDTDRPGLIELSPEEAALIDGGNIYQPALMLMAAFGAGFNFGFHVLGPRIFG